MTDKILPAIMLLALLAGIIALFINGARKNAREKKVNFAVNNSIADLIEDGAIIRKGGVNLSTSITKGTGLARNEYAQRVYDAGFSGKKSVSAKKFHENLYVYRVYLRDSMGVVPPNVLDLETTPKTRIENNGSLTALLPLLILGDEEGASTKAANDSYGGDTSYVGANSYSSGCDSFGGGDSSCGGEDGGGGGGGD